MGKEKKSSEKKRKSADVEKEQPSESQKFAKISVRTEDKDSTGCLLACFSDAPPPFEVLHNSEGGVKFECKRNKKTGQRTLSGESDRLTFEGNDASEHGTSFKYLMAMYDPEAEKIVLVEPGVKSSGGHVFSLKRKVKGMEQHASGLRTLTKEQARDALVAGFGSKRVKSVHRQRKGVQLQAESEEAMEVVEKALQVKKEEAEARGGGAHAQDADAGPNELAPACNAAATKLAEVYTEQSLLPAADWAAVSGASVLEGTKEDKDSELNLSLPLFVRALLPYLAGLDKKGKKKTSRLLAFVAALIAFNKLPAKFSKSADAIAEEVGVSPQVALALLRSFASSAGGEFTRPQTTRDKLLLYLGVAVLLATDYSCTIDNLATDLRLHPDKLSNYFKELGATVSKVKGLKADAKAVSYKVSLKLPLTFPKKSRGGPKR